MVVRYVYMKSQSYYSDGLITQPMRLSSYVAFITSCFATVKHWNVNSGDDTSGICLSFSLPALNVTFCYSCTVSMLNAVWFTVNKTMHWNCDRIYWIQCSYVASQLLLTFMSADTGIYNNRPCVPRIDQQSGGSIWAVCASVRKSLMGVSRWSLCCHVCTCCVHTLKTISILELYLTKGCCILCSVCDSSELILSAKQVKKKMPITVYLLSVF